MRFVKMQGAGNDYVYVDGLAEKVEDPAALARRISDRHFGVGSDGLILILPSEKADFRMRMWNPDGSESPMCGNGIRCVGKFVYDRKLTRKKEIAVETGERVVALELQITGGRVGEVRADMGAPLLDRADVPMAGPPGRVLDDPLELGAEVLRVTCCSMGNPHCVLFVENLDGFAVNYYGPAIEKHPAFPRRTNVEFVQILSRGEVRQRTWERGTGETLACGSGACAVAVAGTLTGKTERKVRIRLRGGDLEAEWAPSGNVYLTGPAEEVFEGEWPAPGKT